MTIELTHTTGADPRSLVLREAMDHETFAIYAESFNAMDPESRQRLETALHTDQSDLVAVVIASEAGVDLGHAALRPLAGGGYEVKKVLFGPRRRGRGLSRILMTAIEGVARDKGEQRLVLQTGPKQQAAIALYLSTGYEHIGEFAPYTGLSDMVYMAKSLGKVHT